MSDVRRTTLALAAGGSTLAVASSAGACAVCFSSAEEARLAYYATTVLLILVPFALLGAIGGWLYRAARRSPSSQAPVESSTRGS